MLTLSQETENLAHRVAEAQKLSVEESVHRALEKEAQTLGVTKVVAGDRVSDEEVARRLAVIRKFQQEFRALPKRDARSIEEIVDEINEL